MYFIYVNRFCHFVQLTPENRFLALCHGPSSTGKEHQHKVRGHPRPNVVLHALSHLIVFNEVFNFYAEQIAPFSLRRARNLVKVSHMQTNITKRDNANLSSRVS